MAKPKMDYKIEVPPYLERYIKVHVLNAPKYVEKIAGIEGVGRVTVMNEMLISVYTHSLYDRDEIALEIERAISSIPDVLLGDESETK